MEREMKPFFAVALLTVSGMMMINHLVLSTPIAEWGLAALLFVLGMAFAVWAGMPERADVVDDLASNMNALPQAREWVISKDVLPDGTKHVQVSGGEALPFDALAEGEKQASEA